MLRCTGAKVYSVKDKAIQTTAVGQCACIRVVGSSEEKLLAQQIQRAINREIGAGPGAVERHYVSAVNRYIVPKTRNPRASPGCRITPTARLRTAKAGRMYPV